MHGRESCSSLLSLKSFHLQKTLAILHVEIQITNITAFRTALNAERELLRCLAEKEPTFAEISQLLSEYVLLLWPIGYRNFLRAS